MIYLCDLDGTIFDMDKLLPLIKGENKKWSEFFARCGEATPIWEVIDVIQALRRAGHTIVFITGRSEEARYPSEVAIYTYLRITTSRSGLGKDCRLIMRQAKDHRPDNIVKSEILDQEFTAEERSRIAGAFEDRQQVVDMYRERDIRVFQIAKGDF